MQAEYQLSLPSLTEASADTIAADRMRAAQAGFGFVPNMYGVMANSPGLLDTYVHGYERFRALSGFTPAEQEVVLLAVMFRFGQLIENLPTLIEESRPRIGKSHLSGRTRQ